MPTYLFICRQVNCRTGKIESSRLLNLRQYINLYNEIAQQASMMTQSMDESAAKTSSITASVIFAEYVQLCVQFYYRVSVDAFEHCPFHLVDDDCT